MVQGPAGSSPLTPGSMGPPRPRALQAPATAPQLQGGGLPRPSPLAPASKAKVRLHFEDAGPAASDDASADAGAVADAVVDTAANDGAGAGDGAAAVTDEEVIAGLSEGLRRRHNSGTLPISMDTLRVRTYTKL